MKILIVYATTDGQTRKIARFCADHLTGAGYTVELMPAGDAIGVELARFDGAILAGSVHVGGFQANLSDFVAAHSEALKAQRTLFLSVSLSAAGDEPEDWAGLTECVAKFQRDTGWTPGQILHVAGAFRFTQYDFFRAWAMRWIASRKGETVDPRADKEYTDWDALAKVVAEWAMRHSQV